MQSTNIRIYKGSEIGKDHRKNYVESICPQCNESRYVFIKSKSLAANLSKRLCSKCNISNQKIQTLFGSIYKKVDYLEMKRNG